MSKDFEFTVSSKLLIAALTQIDPSISALISGDHGTGKSQIVVQVAEALGLPLIDRRLSQMTEGDLIGLPDKGSMDETGVTKFVPVDWFVMACEQPVVLFLDEYNRATPEIQQAGMQITLDRELNGLKLHPETRVFAAINPPGQYDVQEMDPALMDRFVKFNYAPTADDWIAWATDNDIDPVIVDFIRDFPNLLRVADLSEAAPGAVTPTPRSYDRLNKQLAVMDMAPTDLAGKTVPPLFVAFAHGLLGPEAANTLAKHIQDTESMIAVEDVLHKYDAKLTKRLKKIPHESLVSLIDRLSTHVRENEITDDEAKNIAKLGDEHWTGEDLLLFWTGIHDNGKITNIQRLHGLFWERLVNALEEQEAAGS